MKVPSNVAIQTPTDRQGLEMDSSCVVIVIWELRHLMSVANQIARGLTAATHVLISKLMKYIHVSQ